MRTTQFTKSSCSLLGSELAAAVQGVAEKHGLLIRYCGGSFSDYEFTARIECKIGTTLEGQSVEEAAFARDCRLYRVSPSAYRQIVEFGGKKIKLIGFKCGRPKYCVVGVDIGTGKTMLWPEAVLKSVQVPLLVGLRPLDTQGVVA